MRRAEQVLPSPLGVVELRLPRAENRPWKWKQRPADQSVSKDSEFGGAQRLARENPR